MLTRRTFLKSTFVGGLGLAAMPLSAFDGYEKLIILHTNDIHCHFEPFPENDPKYAGRGGLNRIAAYIKELRKNNPDLLLLDSGDFSQGTPYYNFYKGEVIFKLMSAMKYDAATIGNHEFDSGLSVLKEKLSFANFPLVISNYNFENTPLKGATQKHLVLERKGIRIGIYGLGIELQGLVGESYYGNTEFLDPLQTALEMEEMLRRDEQCDLVICLSHLGFKYDSPKFSDLKLAENTYETDLILGGHTHTFLDAPVEVQNKVKTSVIINQVGWAALMLGQLEFYFEKQKKTLLDFSGNKRVG